MLVSVLCGLLAQIVVHAPSALDLQSEGVSGEAPLLISGGTVITNDDSLARAEAVLVVAGRIAAVGSFNEVRERLPKDEVRHLDLKGAFLYPGFADGHAHLTGIGLAMSRVNLIGTRSYREVLDRVKEFADSRPSASTGNAAPAEATPSWLLGRGWDQNDWSIQEFPTHQMLSAAFPDTPVYLSRVDGHAALANRAAMEAAGISAETADPPGGRIIRGSDGEATGVFIDSAMNLISDHVPATSDANLRIALKMAEQALHEQGFTSIHDAGASRRQIAIFQQMAAAGELDLRVHVMVSADRPDELEYWLNNGPQLDPNDQVQVRAIKVYTDGALGSRGAAMLEDYADDPGNNGLLITEPEELTRLASRGLQAGFQVCAHAIGDRGNRLTLQAYRLAFESSGAQRNPIAAAEQAEKTRFRIEHAQVVAVEDIPLFAELGVLPAMQPQHQVSDMPWAEDRVGPDRVRGAYAWKSMINAGSIVIGGSDAPVEQLDSVGSFLAAITRADADGNPKGGWYPQEAMSRAEALKSLTSWPAYGAFWEDELGSISVGKRADFTILSADLMKAPVAELRQTKVLGTVFGGELVYQVAD